MKSWKSVPLGEVIQQRKEFIEIDDIQTYKRARVQLHAKGIVLRDIVEGSLVKTKQQQVSRAGEFLVAEIDAKVGGFGMSMNCTSSGRSASFTRMSGRSLRNS